MTAQPQPSWIGLPLLVPSTERALDEMFWQRACELRVAVPAVVTAFNAANQTVTVQPAVQESIYQNLVPTPTSIPALPGVPVMFPRAGGFTLTFPIVPGDECLVVFADMCINSWWGSGGTQNAQEERRRHDLSDGFALFGPWNSRRSLSGYSTSAAQLRSDDGLTVVEVGAGEISLTTDGGVTAINMSAGVIDLVGTIKINHTLFTAHEHSGVVSGGSLTGPVFP